ncbi:MAG TPA: hypothetical protein VH300_08345 [Thermoleophilaceae bacterium]|nr:hypothetical protein [Thermoleophilaceae bacterium]
MSATPDPRDLTLGAAVSAFRAGMAVGRLGLAPARVAARAPLVAPALAELEARGRRSREEATDQLVQVLNVLLAGPLTEAVARSLVEQRVIERMVSEITTRMDVAQTVANALDSPVVIEVTERFLASGEMQSAVAHIAATPELRQALREQSSGLAEEMVGGLRRRSQSMDETAERTVRGWWRKPRPRTT